MRQKWGKIKKNSLPLVWGNPQEKFDGGAEDQM